MKSTKRHFTLEPGEYLITPDHPLSNDIQIYIKGKDVAGECVGVILYKR